MSSSNFPADLLSQLVADASVAINLNATGCAAQILRALPQRLVVTVNALEELKSGLYKGYRDADQLQELIDDGLVQLRPLSDGCMPVYESLIEGSQTLDDGEAATIALAIEAGNIAILDERRARRICMAQFESLAITSTAELLLHEAIATSLGPQAQIDAIYGALKQGRMHVPQEQIEAIVSLLGDRALECSSLPKKARAG